MAICYDRLFHMMIDKKITNAQLKEMTGVSGNIITRLKRNEYISLESIEKSVKHLIVVLMIFLNSSIRMKNKKGNLQYEAFIDN